MYVQIIYMYVCMYVTMYVTMCVYFVCMMHAMRVCIVSMHYVYKHTTFILIYINLNTYMYINT